jgi:transcriptional regulator of acetoin/glycerol metabolism
MKPKIVLVTNDPAARMRLSVGLEGADVHLARDEEEARHLVQRLRESEPQGASEAPWTRPGEILPFEEYERRILLHALNTTGWNVKQAASRLGIGRATLYRKIDRYDLRGRNAG